MGEDYTIRKEIGKNIAELQFVSFSDDLIACIEKLTKSALRAGGRAVTKVIKEHLGKWTGSLGNYVATSVSIDKSTGQPSASVGFRKPSVMKRKHLPISHASPYWIEFGTKAHPMKPRNRGGKVLKTMGNNGYWYGAHVIHPGQPAQHVLRDTVYQNIDEITKAEEKYLKKLNGELEEALRIAEKEGGEEEYIDD